MSETPRPESIKICWRASFQQPVKYGPLNPGGFNLTAIIEVEIRKSGDGWKAFRPRTRDEFPIASQPRASTLKRQILGVLFEKQESQWKPYEMVSPVICNELRPEEFWLDENEKAWRKTS